MNTYTWKINSLNCTTSDNKTNVVSKIGWELKATNGKNTVSLNDFCYIDLDKNQSFIDYSKLTESQVMSWVQETMGSDQMKEMQKGMDTQLIVLDNAIIATENKPIPLPWNV